MIVTKKQVLAMFGVFALVRGVIDAFRPVDETTAESAAYDKEAFNATMEAIDHKVETCGKEA